MKNTFLFISIMMFGISAAYSSNAKDFPVVSATSMQPGSKSKSDYDFGKIKVGQPVSTTFTWKNDTKKPLVISNVNTGCGCTTSNWDEKPVMPGKTFSITVNYNAAYAGSFYKTITVQYAGGGQKEFSIKGEVVE